MTCHLADVSIRGQLGRSGDSRRSNKSSEWPEFGHCCHQPLPGQRVQVVIDRIGRVFQTRPNLAHGGAEGGWFKPDLSMEKCVGMHCLDPMGSESFIREVTQILGHDGVATPDDGSGENMPVVGIGKLKRRNQAVIAGHQTIPRRGVHLVTRPFQRGPVPMRLIEQQRLDPFAVDIGGPPGPEYIRDREVEAGDPAWGQDRGRSHQKGQCRHSRVAITHVVFLCLGDELIKDRFAVGIDPCLVGHDIFHADTAMRSDLAAREGLFLQ